MKLLRCNSPENPTPECWPIRLLLDGEAVCYIDGHKVYASYWLEFDHSLPEEGKTVLIESIEMHSKRYVVGQLHWYREGNETVHWECRDCFGDRILNPYRWQEIQAK